MCCLPNKFPLPIFLIVNKSLKMEDENISIGMDNIKEISENNLFYKHFVIKPITESRISKIEESSERPSKLSTYVEEMENPLFEMIELILKFKDLREKIVNHFVKRKTSKVSSKDGDFKDDSRNNDKKSCLIL